MALKLCYFIAYLQIMSAGFNLWGFDPLILFNMPAGRNTILVGIFQLTYIIGLVGAILMLQGDRRGFVLSIVHHLLLMPALVVTGWGLVMLMDDRINVTLLFMSKPSGGDVGFFASLGWNTVFQQVTRNVPAGSTYFGINLFAFACATILWAGMDEMYEEDEDEDEDDYEFEEEPPRRGAPARRPPQLALPAPQRQSHPPYYPQPQPQRMQAAQGARQPRRPPPRREF
jgi:hypothetical protein